MPELSIVIVSYNTRVDLERCLTSLNKPPPSVSNDIIVVDNQSSDGSVESAKRFPRVTVIDAGANRGFAAACNIGIRNSTGDMVLLLNPDTVVNPGAVDGLVRQFWSHADVAVVGPRIVDADGRPELSFGKMVSPLAEWRQKRLVKGLERRNRATLRRVDEMTRQEQWPDWVSGACLLVKRADAESVGLLDERYFMYLEDVDFCAAIRANGRRILFSPAAEVVHLRGRSAATSSKATHTAYRRSQIAFYEKHHPSVAPLLRMYLRWRGQSPE
jgi:N-acetylglucosaminyl-diphospho-decaprenol L-rhamnosyltransferase